MVFVEKRKREWQWNADGGDNESGSHSPNTVLAREADGAGIVGKSPVRSSAGSENALWVNIRAFQQLKRCRSQAAEGKQDKLPEHFDASRSTEDAMETVVSTQPETEREEN